MVWVGICEYGATEPYFLEPGNSNLKKLILTKIISLTLKERQ